MLARRFIGGHWKMADQHYGITRGDYAGVTGYEHYDKRGAMLKQMYPEVMLDNTTAPHIYGTPETCVRRIRALRDKFKTNHCAAIFSDGGIPAEMAERNIRRFAAEVLPELRRDEAGAAHTPSAPHRSKGGLPGKRETRPGAPNRMVEKGILTDCAPPLISPAAGGEVWEGMQLLA